MEEEGKKGKKVSAHRRVLPPGRGVGWGSLGVGGRRSGQGQWSGGPAAPGGSAAPFRWGGPFCCSPPACSRRPVRGPAFPARRAGATKEVGPVRGQKVAWAGTWATGLCRDRRGFYCPVSWLCFWMPSKSRDGLSFSAGSLVDCRTYLIPLSDFCDVMFGSKI